MSFLDLKARTRRLVQQTFAVPCVLQTGAGSFTVTARHHNKMALGGDIAGEGYASIIEGINRVIFNREELSALDDGIGVTPARGDRVIFFDYNGTGLDVTVELDARDPFDGPIDEKWTVAPV